MDSATGILRLLKARQVRGGCRDPKNREERCLKIATRQLPG
jgi:hypothetical protein